MARSAKLGRLILATTLQLANWLAYMARMMFVSSRPVRGTKASISLMRSSLSSSLSAPSPWMTSAPGNFSLMAWQRAALESMTVTRFWMSCNSLTQVVRDAAGADDHDVVGAGLEDVQLAEEAFQLAGAGGQVNLVAFLQHRSAGGDDGLLAAGDRADRKF